MIHLDCDRKIGNGFLFENYDSNGLFWAINEAMLFYDRPPNIKASNIRRIMKESLQNFNHSVTAHRYINLYEKMLKRPLVNDASQDSNES